MSRGVALRAEVWWRRMQREIWPLCQEHGIGVMAYGSLAFGLLTGTFTDETAFGKDDWRSRAGGSMAGMRLFDALFATEDQAEGD